MVNSAANQLPTDIMFEKQLGQLATWVCVMRQAGLPIEEALQMPIDDPEMRKRLVRFWNSCGRRVRVGDSNSTGLDVRGWDD